MSPSSAIAFIDDRREAITLALQNARRGDTVLVAGKGHECFQEMADMIIPFDDVSVIRDLLQVKHFLKFEKEMLPVFIYQLFLTHKLP